MAAGGKSAAATARQKQFQEAREEQGAQGVEQHKEHQGGGQEERRPPQDKESEVVGAKGQGASASGHLGTQRLQFRRVSPPLVWGVRLDALGQWQVPLPPLCGPNTEQ